ncbi:MAG: radical SAM protein [Candidatus Omnitrophica bacterium]|nr:radical SAM protein [Candidatus Omnitrophota bacterium]
MLVSWNVTRGCNLKCRHCYRDAGLPAADELSTAEGFELLKQVAACGFNTIILSGGEPLLRKDIFELIACARGNGLRPVLGTNATLIDAAVARQLKKAGLARVGISLDSVDAAAHNDFRQQEDAWQNTVSAMEALRREGLDFQVHTTVTRMNLKGINEVTDFGVLKGALAHHVFFLVPAGRGKNISDAAITKKEYYLLLKKLAMKQKTSGIEVKPVCAPQFMALENNREERGEKRYSRGCLAGIAYACVLPNGDVHPCPYLPVRAGNVRETKLTELWKDSPIFTRLRSMRYSGACASCEHKQSCGGCRGRAWAECRDYMAQDPYCFNSKCAYKEGVAA